MTAMPGMQVLVPDRLEVTPSPEHEQCLVKSQGRPRWQWDDRGDLGPEHGSSTGRDGCQHCVDIWEVARGREQCQEWPEIDWCDVCEEMERYGAVSKRASNRKS